MIQRSIRCYGKLVYDQPLGVYRNRDGQFENITDDLVNQELQYLAMKTFNLDPNDPEDLAQIKLYTTHSLRVGATVILHAHGCSAEDIKRIIRWESNAYLIYLRDMPFLSKKQNAAVANADDFPNFI